MDKFLPRPSLEYLLMGRENYDYSYLEWISNKFNIPVEVISRTLNNMIAKNKIVIDPLNNKLYHIVDPVPYKGSPPKDGGLAFKKKAYNKPKIAGNQMSKEEARLYRLQEKGNMPTR